MHRLHLKILAAAVLVLALPLSACGSRALYSPENPVSITVWTYYNGAQLTSFNNLVNEFNETEGRDLGIFVESFSQGSVNDLEANVLAAAAGKVGADEIPNIFAAYADTAYALDQMGLVVNIADYLSDEEQALYIDSYLQEGHFTADGGLKIFPTAKSTEIFLLNKTDWELFASETDVSYDSLRTIEGVVETAQIYYEWTDSLTPEPDDGKAFFGRDAMANYMLIGAMQLGTEIFSVEDGNMTLHFDRETVKKLWDCYYVPFVKGYFAASGRFRSDDVKTGNILAFVGSSSGATFFPEQVIISDTESYPIEMEALTAPEFEGGKSYAVQQGAGMVVTTADEGEVEASVDFLKWFTDEQRNIRFSVDSGYLPVMKSANSIEVIRSSGAEIGPAMDEILSAAVETVQENELYTPRAFFGGTNARSVLEYGMSDRAEEDRKTVVERIAAGESLGDASAKFLSEEYFDAWYEKTLAELKQYEY